jgi:hypothetical protein
MSHPYAYATRIAYIEEKVYLCEDEKYILIPGSITRVEQIEDDFQNKTTLGYRVTTNRRHDYEFEVLSSRTQAIIDVLTAALEWGEVNGVLEETLHSLNTAIVDLESDSL